LTKDRYRYSLLIEAVMKSPIYMFIILMVLISNCTRKTGVEFNDEIRFEAEIPDNIQEVKTSMYVNAPEGLRVRNSPGLDGDRIALLENLTEVLIIEEDENNVNIDGINGKWTFIEADNIRGWVFGGYLSTEFIENHSMNRLEDDGNSFPIPATYEEALELMNRLQIENVVLEKIIINNEIHTVVEIREIVLTVAGDGIVEAYDIPDISGNVIFFVANPPPKLEIYVRGIAIVEEPYINRFGNNDHWLKIRMDDGRVGWIKGEDAGLDRGGIKYQTHKNIWLWENYTRHLI
jgi:hypothetical protein